ncbi:MAG: hypothetical protein SOV24_03375, partial [Muribaculaceae bacterium]|nr:hypothetical protein [Bacteroidales bacterium]MDY2733388.1 hypothetical protein [Muribaculaceae bacterium]
PILPKKSLCHLLPYRLHWLNHDHHDQLFENLGKVAKTGVKTLEKWQKVGKNALEKWHFS